MRPLRAHHYHIASPTGHRPVCMRRSTESRPVRRRTLARRTDPARGAKIATRVAETSSRCEGITSKAASAAGKTRKVAWIALLTALVGAPAWAAVTAATAASSHVGQSVTVEGLVSEVHTARSGKETFIDIGARIRTRPSPESSLNAARLR